jgi:hypothetical protein
MFAFPARETEMPGLLFRVAGVYTHSLPAFFLTTRKRDRAKPALLSANIGEEEPCSTDFVIAQASAAD